MVSGVATSAYSELFRLGPFKQMFDVRFLHIVFFYYRGGSEPEIEGVGRLGFDGRDNIVLF